LRADARETQYVCGTHLDPPITPTSIESAPLLIKRKFFYKIMKNFQHRAFQALKRSTRSRP
ncbi:hypothetical protein QSH82_24880, partial [Escherichia coli]|uniref:hypothetical protein n=1 Tax=Escherichia coli TaxID=562 RepID=UPI00256F467A